MTTDKQIEFYQTADGQTEIEVRLEDETIWVTQTQMAEVFATTTDNISLHLKNIYNDGELEETSTTEDFSVVRQEGKRQVRRQLQHYNLDAIISVGYRVNSAQATRFRQWSTRVLRDYLTQGYALDKTRFEKNAAELEQALSLIQKAAKSPELTGSSGRGLVDISPATPRRFSGSSDMMKGCLMSPLVHPVASCLRKMQPWTHLHH